MESFDLRDTIVPISLLRISNHFRMKNAGETLEIICSEQDLIEDLNYLLPEPAYEFLSLVRVNAADPEFRIVVKKAKDLQPMPAKSWSHCCKNRRALEPPTKHQGDKSR
jgi:TusA-related sulfurtransferase